MSWTRTPPSERGTYWTRTKRGDMEVVEFYGRDVWKMRCTRALTVRHVYEWWPTPIPPPPEPRDGV